MTVIPGGEPLPIDRALTVLERLAGVDVARIDVACHDDSPIESRIFGDRLVADADLLRARAYARHYGFVAVRLGNVYTILSEVRVFSGVYHAVTARIFRGDKVVKSIRRSMRRALNHLEGHAEAAMEEPCQSPT